MLTAIVGAASLSRIVPTPTALVFAVVPLLTVAVRLKVSVASSMVSLVTATRTCTEVCPAAKVIPPAGTATQLVPLLYSNAVPVSVPTIAVPLLNVGLNTIGPELGLLRLTVNVA